MTFKEDGSRDGALVYGYEKGWHWTRNKGGYHQKRDFFWIHWEISATEPTIIKLHVECPKAEVDPELNAIKQEVVKSFLAPQFKKKVEESGYIYKPSTRNKSEHVERYCSTAPFHVIVTKEQEKGSPQANIEMVNEALGDDVRSVVETFRGQLNRHFLS